MNDAPALKKANVGIAVAGATAAAKGAADITLTQVGGRLPAWRLISAACSTLGSSWALAMMPILRRQPVIWLAGVVGLSRAKAIPEESGPPGCLARILRACHS